jgi:hypothetical protein
MELEYINNNGSVIALLKDDVVATIQDALDLIGTASYYGADSVIIPMERLSPDFFSLKTRFAGEVLQKFVNYSMRAAIVGNFSGYQSESLQAFIRESNRGRHVCFMPTIEDAISALGGHANGVIVSEE